MYREVQRYDQVVVCLTKEAILLETSSENWQPNWLCAASDTTFQANGAGPQGLGWVWLMGDFSEHGGPIQASILGPAA